MLAITRFRVPEAGAPDFQTKAYAAMDLLAACPGFVDATLGRATDDTTLWLMASTWRNVGSYRRALSTYDVKVGAVPLLSQAVDEPSAYEVIRGQGANRPNEDKPRGGS